MTARNLAKTEQLALALAGGETVRAAAARLGVADSTARRWSASPAFRARVAELRAELTSLAVGRLAEASAEAVEVLRRAMCEAPSDHAKIAAAKAILDKLPIMSEYFDITERVRQLEDRVNAPRIAPRTAGASRR